MMSLRRIHGLPKALRPDVNPSLCCGLCENILCDPMQSGSCGHRFCKACIDDKKSENVEFDCPSCLKEGELTKINFNEEGEIFADRGVLRELAKLHVNCIYCKQRMELRKWKDDHLASCENKPVSCPKGCGEMIPSSMMNEHFKKCPEEDEACQSCKQNVKRRELETHRSRECPSLYTQCEFCGSQVFHSQLDAHKKSECTVSWSSSCPYGCTAINEPNLMSHRESNMSSHLDRLHARIARDEHSGSLIDALSECGQRIGEFTALIKYQEERLKAQERQANQMAMTIEEQSLQLAACIEELRILKSVNYDGTLLWRIDNFSEKREAARSGKRPSIFSPPFFTSRHGYQMCARLYPNGDGLGQGSHMSLFFVLMRGPYDPLLKWPFQQKVTFLLKDQKGKADVVDAFRPDPSGESFRRPNSLMNIASGSPRFLPLHDLDDVNKGYVVEDVMFVRIIVDCSTLV